ncbi:hypothetical protein GGR94_001867 [Sulfitobacter geojensis]|nr:hypothetical protein [Sulfitobacter geojensis]
MCKAVTQQMGPVLRVGGLIRGAAMGPLDLGAVVWWPMVRAIHAPGGRVRAVPVALWTHGSAWRPSRVEIARCRGRACGGRPLGVMRSGPVRGGALGSFPRPVGAPGGALSPGLSAFLLHYNISYLFLRAVIPVRGIFCFLRY